MIGDQYPDVAAYFQEVDVDFERKMRRGDAVAGAIAAVKIYGMDLDPDDLPEFFQLVRDGLTFG